MLSQGWTKNPALRSLLLATQESHKFGDVPEPIVTAAQVSPSPASPALHKAMLFT